MKGDILYEKVVITDSEEEINAILADGSFRVRSVIPIPFANEVKFEGANANGTLSGGKLCYVLAKVEGLEYKPNN